MKPADCGAHNKSAIYCEIAASKEGVSTYDLADRLNLSDRTILEHVRALRADGKVSRKGGRWIKS